MFGTHHILVLLHGIAYDNIYSLADNRMPTEWYNEMMTLLLWYMVQRLRFGIWYNLSLVNGHMATLTIEYHLRLMGYILVDAMAMVQLDVSFRC